MGTKDSQRRFMHTSLRAPSDPTDPNGQGDDPCLLSDVSISPPTSTIRPGGSVVIQWQVTPDPGQACAGLDVRLNGESVGRAGQKVVRPRRTREYHLELRRLGRSAYVIDPHTRIEVDYSACKSVHVPHSDIEAFIVSGIEQELPQGSYAKHIAASTSPAGIAVDVSFSVSVNNKPDANVNWRFSVMPRVTDEGQLDVAFNRWYVDVGINNYPDWWTDEDEKAEAEINGKRGLVRTQFIAGLSFLVVSKRPAGNYFIGDVVLGTGEIELRYCPNA